MGMHDIWPLKCEHLGETVGERSHVGPQVVLRNLRSRPSWNVHNLVSGSGRQPLLQAWIIAPGVYRYRMPESDKSRGKLSNVNVLTAGVDASDGGQRTCMFRHQGHAHGTSPHPLHTCWGAGTRLSST
jgi:hypothetical protein